MSTTRLLVLGAVRIFAPVHGYVVRRELLSWHAEHWAHLNPGSIYNALRSLTRDGYLEESGRSAVGGRPARTSYELTPDGAGELHLLLREALWNVAPHEPDKLLAGWSFAWLLSRDEVLSAMESRLQQIAASSRATAFTLSDLGHSDGKPAHVAEHWLLTQARMDGEALWLQGLLERLRAGEYWFEGEPDQPWPISGNTAVRDSEYASAGEHKRSGGPHRAD